MKNFVLFIIFFFIGLIGISGCFVWKNNEQPISSPRQPTAKQEKMFDVAIPPGESRKGKITLMSGNIKWESRTATGAATIDKPVTIQQGESLATDDDGKVTVNFESGESLALLPETEVAIIQTLPINFVYSQTKGTASYGTNASPVSVRCEHLIVRIDKGSITIMIDEDELTIITISVGKGKAAVGFNDLDNLSHVVNLDEGQKYIFDDSLREGNIQ